MKIDNAIFSFIEINSFAFLSASGSTQELLRCPGAYKSCLCHCHGWGRGGGSVPEPGGASEGGSD